MHFRYEDHFRSATERCGYEFFITIDSNTLPTVYSIYMSSLTETAYYARRMRLIGRFWVLSRYIILRIFWSILRGLLGAILFPPKLPPPNHAFGKLPAVKFPAVATPSAQITFQLETIQGTSPICLIKCKRVFYAESRPEPPGA